MARATTILRRCALAVLLACGTVACTGLGVVESNGKAVVAAQAPHAHPDRLRLATSVEETVGGAQRTSAPPSGVAVKVDAPWPGKPELSEAEGRQALADALVGVESAEAWQQRARRIRDHLALTLQLAPRPDRRVHPVEITRVQLREGFSVANLRLESVPGLFVHASLWLPRGRKGPFPLVLRAHGHWTRTAQDHEGRFQSEVQIQCATLARAGCAVISWDMMGWGESLQLPHADARNVALQTWNTMALLDWALARPDVDAARVAMTGASGGGTQTFLAAALDERIRVSVPVVMVSAHFFGGCACESGLPIHDVPAQPGGNVGAYANVGRLHTTNAELAALAAPRPQLLISCGGDWTRNTPAVEFPFVQHIYELHGSHDQVANAHFPAEGHDYGINKRAAAIRFLADKLGFSLDTVRQLDGSLAESLLRPLAREDLVTTTVSAPLPARALADADAIWNAFLAMPRTHTKPAQPGARP